jgi:hypothetical protein
MIIFFLIGVEEEFEKSVSSKLTLVEDGSLIVNEKPLVGASVSLRGMFRQTTG